MPNGFYKMTSVMSNNKEPNKLQAARYDFWTRLIEYSSNSKITILKNRNANTDHWMTISIGTSQVHMEIKLNNKRYHIEISFYIPDNKEIYEDLESYKDEIESEAKHALIWRNPQKKKRQKLFLKSQD